MFIPTNVTFLRIILEKSSFEIAIIVPQQFKTFNLVVFVRSFIDSMIWIRFSNYTMLVAIGLSLARVVVTILRPLLIGGFFEAGERSALIVFLPPLVKQLKCGVLGIVPMTERFLASANRSRVEHILDWVGLGFLYLPDRHFQFLQLTHYLAELKFCALLKIA